jgi:hypothetical protein
MAAQQELARWPGLDGDEETQHRARLHASRPRTSPRTRHHPNRRLVDRVQVTLFPVITGQTGQEPIFGGAADFDLELIESRTLDGNI